MTVDAPPLDRVHIGPTWERGANGRFIFPERTLGYEILDWVKLWLLQPDGPNAGLPWEFSPEQGRFLLWWYALDEAGRFAYRSGVYRRMKGAGKNPFAAVLSAVEFIGPCRPSGKLRADGSPAGMPHHSSWIQVAAVSREQNRNSMTLMPAIFSKAAIAEHQIDLGKEIIYAYKGRCRIEAVTSSPRALEGGRATFCVMDETHHWMSSNEGHAMANVIARNAAKSRDGSSRVLAITNAHNPGEDSVAEHDYEAYLKIAAGQSKAGGFLYDSLEAPPDTDLSDPESLRRGIEAARGDSKWLDIDRLVEEIYDPRTAPSTARRFYLNQIVAAEDAWLSPQEWNRLKRDDDPILPGDQVTLGLDGSKNDDHTVIAGARIRDGRVFLLEAWDPAENINGEIPLDRVDTEVAKAFSTYDVVGFYADRNHFTAYNAKWEQDYGETLCARASAYRPIEWDMSHARAAALAAQAYHDAIMEEMVTHGGDLRLDQYHYNARRKPTNYDGAVTFGKESAFSSRKVDGVAAAVLAWKARQDYLALPENKKRQAKRKAGAFFA